MNFDARSGVQNIGLQKHTVCDSMTKRRLVAAFSYLFVIIQNYRCGKYSVWTEQIFGGEKSAFRSPHAGVGV